jgi:hypothetical protein
MKTRPLNIKTKTEKQVDIPQVELLRTLKALLLERALGYQRSLDQKTGDWQWLAPVKEGEAPAYLTWETMPDLFGDLPLIHQTAVTIITAAHRQRRTTFSVAFNPSLQGGPWGCRIVDIEDEQQVVKAQAVGSQQSLAIVAALLAYYGVNEPQSFNRKYIPAPNLELGNARQNPPAGNPAANGGAAIFSGPGAREPGN